MAPSAVSQARYCSSRVKAGANSSLLCARRRTPLSVLELCLGSKAAIGQLRGGRGGDQSSSLHSPPPAQKQKSVSGLQLNMAGVPRRVA